MNNFQRLSVEYDGIYGTIDDYTSDANLMNYLFKLKEAISDADYDTIMYTLSAIDKWYDENIRAISSNVYVCNLATVYKGNIIKNLIMDCQSYTKYRPNETTGGIFVSWRRKEELPTGA